MTRGTTLRNVRVDDALWDAACDRTMADGTNVSEVIRSELRRWLGVDDDPSHKPFPSRRRPSPDNPLVATSAQVRLSVYERDSWRCVYCGLKFSPAPEGYAPRHETAEVWLELDHIQAASRGGPDELENYRSACSTCNARRGVDESDKWSDRIVRFADG
jgi:hypothetical protein